MGAEARAASQVMAPLLSLGSGDQLDESLGSFLDLAP